MKTNKLIYLLLVSLFTLSCSNDSESDLVEVDEPIDETPSDTPINYTDDIQPIIGSSCVGCHASTPVNGAPTSYVNFSQVSLKASTILSRMNRQNGAAGAMPPSGRLPQATIDKVQQWIDNGKPEN